MRRLGATESPVWSTRALLAELGRQLVRLAEEEVDLARAELISDARSAGWAVIGLGLAGMAAVAGLTLLLVAAVLALGQVMPGWLAALVVAVGVFAAGVMAGWLGWTYRPRTPLALTRKSLKEDWKWLKDLVA
jgi:uncharacterized membrane protein YqjE